MPSGFVVSKGVFRVIDFVMNHPSKIIVIETKESKDLEVFNPNLDQEWIGYTKLDRIRIAYPGG